MRSDSLHGHSGGIRITRRLPEHFSGRNRMNTVYVLSPDRTPLMPCSSVIARLLLKEGKAKVVHRTPFTIKLYALPENTYTQPLTLGVDTGSRVIGSAVASEQGTILYLSEVEVRNDIATTMKERATHRRDRRNRKTRYRAARWLNRRNSLKTGQYSPTMRSKLDAHLREIRFANTRAYVLTRDGYTCQHCKGKFKDQRLEVHHIVFRSQHG